eukprot:4575914-Alexandrium_andersonii.AAC.1
MRTLEQCFGAADGGESGRCMQETQNAVTLTRPPNVVTFTRPAAEEPEAMRVPCASEEPPCSEGSVPIEAKDTQAPRAS